MIEYLISNKEWIFSGVGVSVVIGGLSWIFYSKENSNKSRMSQKGGDNSTNIQVGGNVESSFRKNKNGNK